MAVFSRLSQEYAFDWHAENIGDTKGEWQRRVIAPCFDRINALPADLEAVGQVLLAPVAFCAKDPEAVPHAHVPAVPIVILL